MHLPSLYLGQLQLVEALARSGSLTAAANELGITQSAASHALAKLRNELSDPLFVRTSDGMQPTPFGRRLADSSKVALHALDAGIAERADFSPVTSTRTFNIIMSDVSQFLYLPALIARLSSEAPQIVIRARPVPPKAPHILLESGEVDLAVGAFTGFIVGCRQRRLYREQYACVVRQDHPLFAKGMSIEAFRSVPQAIVDPRGYVHEQLDHLLTQQQIPRKPKLHVPYFLSLLPVIRRTNLLLIMASRLAHAFAELAPLKIMSPPIKLPTYNVSLFWHERFNRDAGNQWLRATYVQLFGDIRGRKADEWVESSRKKARVTLSSTGA
jgi:DNA-binding transcriptional LysR family regulator